MKTVKVGLDIGNSSVKGVILSEQNALLKTILLPSAVNYMHDERTLAYLDPNTRYVQVIDSPLAHSNDIAAIGQRAMELPGYQQFDVGSTSYKTDHELTASLLYGVIGDLVGAAEEICIILAVSVPIVESKTFHLVEQYQARLTGDHKIKLYEATGSREVTIHIQTAKVLNEGQAGFFGLLDTQDKTFRKTMDTLYSALGEQSNMIPTLEDFLVVDIGEGTTDLAVFRGKRFNPEYSYSVTKGYGTVLELAMAAAEREGVTMESRKALQSLLTTDNPRRKGQKEMWQKYVTPVKEEYIDEIITTLLKAYGRQSFLDAVIFLGGGFSALTGYNVADDGTITNAEDYLFQNLKETMEKNHKQAGIIFGVPGTYAQTVNSRGLMQVLTGIPVKK